MRLKNVWVGLLCICFALTLFDCQSARDGGNRQRERMPRWEGPPIGSEVKDFELPVLDGGAFKLSDQRGRIIVLEMGACT